MNYFAIESSPTNVNLRIKSLIEETKPVVTEENEFEHRDKLIYITLFGFFGIPGFWCNGQKERLLNRSHFYKFYVLN